MAISSPLLEDLSIEGAHGVLINITGGSDLSLFEVNEASTVIQEAAHEEANIIFGAVIDENMPEGEMRVTVIATGLNDDYARRGRDRDSDLDAHDNVTPLRRDSASFERAPASAERPQPAPLGSAPEQTAMLESPAPEHTRQSDEWVSPFEDELDVPTFIRRGSAPDDGDEDREEPAFLRRSAD